MSSENQTSPISRVDAAHNHLSGDQVSAHIGENSSSVAVGKNILQIGSIQIPYYALALILLCIILITGSVIVVAINSTPTPSPAATIAPMVSPTPIDANTEINFRISQIYQEILDRKPTSDELKSLSGWSLEGIRQYVAKTEDARKQLNQIYQEELFRDIDQSGYDIYSSALIDGWTLTMVREHIRGSEEYRSKH